MKRAALMGCMVAIASSAPAQNMPINTFLAKAGALERQGPLALFSRDYKLLQAEIKASVLALRAQNAAEVSSHRKPNNCMPSPVAVSPDDVLKSFRAIPADQQPKLTTQIAINNMMAKRYPCP